MKVKIKNYKNNTGFYAVLLPAEIKMKLSEFKSFYSIDTSEEIRQMIIEWTNKVETEILNGRK